MRKTEFGGKLTLRTVFAVPFPAKQKESGVGSLFLYMGVRPGGVRLLNCTTCTDKQPYTRHYWSKKKLKTFNSVWLQELITLQIESIPSCKRPLTRGQRGRERRGQIKGNRILEFQHETSTRRQTFTSQDICSTSWSEVYCEPIRSQLSQLARSYDVIACFEILNFTPTKRPRHQKSLRVILWFQSK